MTLAKKGRRKICVDGIQYHWRVMRKTDKVMAAAYGYYVEPLLYFIVELDKTPAGSILICESGYLLKNDQITPRTVETAIQTALAKGWNPAQAGQPFVLDLIKNSDKIPDKTSQHKIAVYEWSSDDLEAFAQAKQIQHQLLDKDLLSVELRLFGNRSLAFSELGEHKGFKDGFYARHGDSFNISGAEFIRHNEPPLVVTNILIKRLSHCESFFTLFTMAYHFLLLEQKGYVVFNQQYKFNDPDALAEFAYTYLVQRFSKETLEAHRLIQFDKIAL